MSNLRKKGTSITGGRPSWFIYAILSFVLVTAVGPFYWTFLIASGDRTSVYDRNLSWIPQGNFMHNVGQVLNNSAVPFWKALGNSLLSSGAISISTILFSMLAGFAFARLRFKGNKTLLVAVVATMAIPSQLGVVPLYILMSRYGWTGNLSAIIIPGLVSAFGVFWMTQYLTQALPSELIEAARVDGCNMIRTFWHVAVPVARPAAFMLGLFTFVGSWNNFFWPFIVLGNQNPTLPVALSLLQAEKNVDWSIVMTGVLLATIPLLLLFIVTGKQLVVGIMQGAVKG